MGTAAQIRPKAEQAAEIQAELARILASAPFANSPRMSRFLRVVVEAALAGDSGRLKEYAIGCSVFDRDGSFDPRIDPVVRNEARRLRQKLQLYYESEHVPAKIRITLPKGGYAPLFEDAERAAPELHKQTPPGVNERRAQPKLSFVLTGFLVVALLACSTLLFLKLRSPAAAKHNPSPQALSAWKKGRHYVEQIGQPMEAITELQKAIRADPQFADAYGTLAAAYGMAALQGKVPMADGMHQAKQFAERALQLDSDSAEGYLMLGAAEVFNRDWTRAEELMRHSLKLRSNDAFALMTTADIALQPQGKLEEAAEMLEQATRLVPGNVVFWETLITVRCEAHQYALARQDIRRALEHIPKNEEIRGALAFISLWDGDVKGGIQIAEHVSMDEGDREYWNMELAIAKNRRGDAKQIAQRFMERPGLDDSDHAVLFAVLGNEEQVLASLNRAEDNRSLKGVLRARLDDHFNDFRSHPGFQQLLRRMRLVR